MTVENPRELLKRYGLYARKSLGQNFLVHPSAPARIAEGAGVGVDDTVLEVGAGLGTLTSALLERAGKVIAVETDSQLTSILEQELGGFDNLQIVAGDILTLNPAELLGIDAAPALPLWGQVLPHYLVVANLPYYITAAVIRHLLEAPVRPARMVVTVQREVADRIVAADGKMSLLAVSVQFYGQPRILFRLKRGAFYPVPAVESAVVCLDVYEQPPAPVTDIDFFFKVVRAGFSQRRKKLRNTLAAGLQRSPSDVAEVLTSVDVAPSRRAETLSIAEWGRVVQALT